MLPLPNNVIIITNIVLPPILILPLPNRLLLPQFLIFGPHLTFFFLFLRWLSFRTSAQYQTSLLLLFFSTQYCWLSNDPHLYGEQARFCFQFIPAPSASNSVINNPSFPLALFNPLCSFYYYYYSFFFLQIFRIFLGCVLFFSFSGVRWEASIFLNHFQNYRSRSQCTISFFN